MPLETEKKLNRSSLTISVATLTGSTIVLVIVSVYMWNIPSLVLSTLLMIFSIITAVYIKNFSRLLDLQKTNLSSIERIGNFAHWKYDAHTEKLFLSQTAYNILGYSPGTLENAADYIAIVHPDDREVTRQRFNVHEDETYTVQYRILTPENEILWIEVYSESIVERHRFAGRFGVLRDITTSRLRENALRESRYKTNRALKLAELFEWEFDLSSQRFKVSEQFGNRLFLTPGKYSFSAEELLTRIDAKSRDKFLQHFGPGGKTLFDPLEMEMRFTRVDGEVFYLKTYGASDVDHQGKPRRRYGLVQDLTRLRQTEKALQESEREKNLVIDTIDVGLALLNTDRRLIWANRALRNIYDIDPEHMLRGDLCYHLQGQNKGPCLNCPVPEAITLRQKVTSEISFKDKVLSITAAPYIVRHDEVERIIVIIRDITRQKELSKQLLHAQKMEAIGRMAGGIAHDFNNILHVILGYSEFAQESCEGETLELLDPITESAHKGHELVKQLLNFSHTETNFNPKYMDLNKTLPLFRDWIKRMIGENIEIRLDVLENLPGIIADSSQIDQVLLNLCINARDAMPDGGELKICAKVVTVEKHSSFLNQILEPGNYIRITVEDTGSGIPLSVQNQIFDPFYTTKDVGKGTGLGLSTVYAVMQKHNGLVKVDSSTESGSTFALYFPVPEELDLDTNELINLHASMQIDDRNYRVLLVEDDPMVRNITIKALEKAGFQILSASDGQSAIDLFAKEVDTIDLVLLDVVLPRKSGREVYEFIQKTRPDTPVIFATGYAADYLQGLPDDAHIIQKPYTKRDLLKLIHSVLVT